jgi:2-polyprenyl-6-methoxyphenol hydroxylase-like FAD-dependent oxidoreductase
MGGQRRAEVHGTLMKMMMQQVRQGDAMRIACVGGGPAGLYFALLMKMHEPGHNITVFERTAADFAYGWGITFDEDLLATLYRSDPNSAQKIEQAAFRLEKQTVDVQGKQELRVGGCYTISRQRLLDILADRAQGLGVHIKFGQEVTAPSQLPEFDLIVACDGVNSRTRLEAGRFQTDMRLSVNKHAWLGTSQVFESFMYLFVRTSSGWIWAYAYRIDDQCSTFIVECSPETWARLGFGTMPSHECLSLLEKLFERHLAGHHLTVQAGNGTDVRWLNFRTVTVQPWHDGKTVLTGDAAHTTHFAIGSGTKLAIEDVIALSENLEHHGELEPAFQSYEMQRKAALRRPQTEARFSAEWFENLSRYIDLKPHEFSALLHGRQSPLLPRLRPRLYYQLDKLTEELTILRALRRQVAPRVKTLYSRPKTMVLSDSSTIHLRADVDKDR